MSQETKNLASAADLNAALRNKRRYDVDTLPLSELTVRFQSLTALERGRLSATTVNKNGDIDPTRMADADARLIATCLVDEEGKRLYDDRAAGLICGWDAADATYLARVLRKHCGLGQDDEEKRQADFTDGSSETGGGDSPTA